MTGDFGTLKTILKTKNRRTGSGPPWRWISLAGLGIAGIVLLFTPVAGKLKRGLSELIHGPAPKPHKVVDEGDLKRQIESRLRAEMEDELETQMDQIKRAAAEERQRAEQTNLPPDTGHTALGGADVRKLSSGIPFKSEIKIDHGGVASRERVDPNSYTAEYRLTVRLPEPAKTLDELKALNPLLGDMLPGLAGLLPKAAVSRWYYELYKNKSERLRREATTLVDLISKHNMFDCETMLNLRAANGRRVFLLQADMDVVSDGSDGDRLATMPDAIVTSANYQPFTSYAWPKHTQTANPIVAGWEKRITEAEKEAALRTTPTARKAWLKDKVAALRRGVADMKSRSFLIADYDPFIVVPVNILNSTGDPFSPRVGDYAVVIHDKRLFPAIVGDGGPTYKTGEASLRIAKEITAAATPNNRPENDLKVTYLVFPGSREETKAAPDYAKWREKCLAMLAEIGGLGAGYDLFQWQNLLPDAQPVQATLPGGVTTTVIPSGPPAPTSRTAGPPPTTVTPAPPASPRPPVPAAPPAAPTTPGTPTPPGTPTAPAPPTAPAAPATTPGTPITPAPPTVPTPHPAG